jgi:hypothetical protein
MDQNGTVIEDFNDRGLNATVAADIRKNIQICMLDFHFTMSNAKGLMPFIRKKPEYSRFQRYCLTQCQLNPLLLKRKIFHLVIWFQVRYIIPASREQRTKCKCVCYVHKGIFFVRLRFIFIGLDKIYIKAYYDREKKRTALLSAVPCPTSKWVFTSATLSKRKPHCRCGHRWGNVRRSASWRPLGCGVWCCCCW